MQSLLLLGKPLQLYDHKKQQDLRYCSPTFVEIKRFNRRFAMTFKYPTARRDGTVVENLHSHQVADPYRWLENPDSAETQAFVKDQNSVFQGFLKQSGIRDKLRDCIKTYYDYPKFGCPTKDGKAYYYFHNSGLQQQSVLYKQDELDGEPRVFFDPNLLSDDGTISLSSTSFSESGKYFAYSLSTSGSDWVKIHTRSTEDGKTTDIDEPINWVKFSGIEWLHDDSGFFYNRYPKPSVDSEKAGTETDSNSNPAVYFHKLGTKQSEDKLIFKDSDNPENMFGFSVSSDGKYLLLTVSESCEPKNKLFVIEVEKVLKNADFSNFITIVGDFRASFSYVANDGPLFYLETTLDAPMGRIVKYDLQTPELGFVELVAETNNVISFCDVAHNDKLIIARLVEVKDVVDVYNLRTGKQLYKLPLPVGSMLGSFQTKRAYDFAFYNFSSYLTPSTTFRFDFITGEHSVFRETPVKGLQTNQMITKQVFYRSKDGTQIPMYLIHKKGLKLNGNNPTLLYGYGGFNISITPSFSVNFLTVVQHLNGIVAVANIRGGGEYGQEKWYNQGRLDKKQYCFDDFQYAAKYLITEKYTCPQKLAINGGSNGGLLVGACLTQTPELFGCAIAEVGVLDMYRFHKFTIGHAWTSDYGNPDVEQDFEILSKYSPLHNIRPNEYPATLILTGDHDDRFLCLTSVVPLHSLKFLAEIQHTAKDNKFPIMGRIETKAGHGAGKSTSQRIEEAADKFAFMALVLNAEWHE